MNSSTSNNQTNEVNIEDLGRVYRACERDIGFFSKVMFPDEITNKIPEFHREMYGFLQKEDRVVIAAPRGFSKSTIVSKIYPLWCALYGKRKDICIVSASEGLAVDHLRWIKGQVMNSEVVKALWGSLQSSKWSENHAIMKFGDGREVTFRAKGAGAQIRGFRPDCVIIDDIEKEDDVKSEEQRKKLKDWVFKACINCLLPGGQFVVIGTVLDHLSFINDLLSMDNGWVKRRYKAYLDGVEDEEHALWQEMRPHSWLQQRKAEIGSHRFSAEFMNDPLADDNAPIKEDHLRYWHTVPQQCNMVIAVDPAYSEDAKSDWKAAALVAMDEQHNRYLVEVLRTHAPMGEYVSGILNMWMRNKGKITALGIPRSGVERAFYDNFMKACQERGFFPPVSELKHTYQTATGQTVRNKKARITAALQPLFEQGKYYIGKEHYEAREELLTYGAAKHEDLVDCMAYAESLLQPGVMMEEELEERPNYYGHNDLAVSPCGCYGMDY